MHETDAIAQTLLAAFMAKAEHLFDTEQGREVARLAGSYSLLSGRAAPWQEVAAASIGDSTTPAVRVSAPPSTINGSRPTREPSMRERVQTILEAAPKVWNYVELVAELEGSGVVLTGQDGDRRGSVRTAVWTLVQKDLVRRGIEDGVFWATKYDDQIRPQDDVEVFDEDPFSDIDPHQIARLSGEEI